MITISYTGMILILCLLLLVVVGLMVFFDFRLRKLINNFREQSMIDSRALAALISKGGS